eukprot:3298372-Amphidinium_carterae.1
MPNEITAACSHMNIYPLQPPALSRRLELFTRSVDLALRRKALHEYADTVAELRKLLTWMPLDADTSQGITTQQWLTLATSQLHKDPSPFQVTVAINQLLQNS